MTMLIPDLFTITKPDCCIVTCRGSFPNRLAQMQIAMVYVNGLGRLPCTMVIGVSTARLLLLSLLAVTAFKRTCTVLVTV